MKLSNWQKFLVPLIYLSLASTANADSSVELHLAGKHIYTQCDLHVKPTSVLSSFCLVDTGSYTSVLWHLPFIDLSNAVPGRDQFINLREKSAAFGSRGLAWNLEEIAINSSADYEDYGLLGIDALGKGLLLFDFPGSKITRIQSLPKDKKAYSLVRNGIGQIIMTGTVKDNLIHVMWDTGGSQDSVGPKSGIDGLVNQKFVSAHPEFFKLVYSESLIGDTKAPPVSVYELLVPIQIGDLTLAQGKTFGAINFAGGYFGTGLDDSMDMVFGYGIMEKNKWYFDFTKNIWMAQ